MLQRFSLEFLGRACAVASALACAALVLRMAWFNPYTLDGPGLNLPIGALLFLAVVAGVAGAARSAGLLLLTFVLSFAPMGLYLLGSPGIFAGIGMAHLGYLLAAALMMLGRRRDCVPRTR